MPPKKTDEQQSSIDVDQVSTIPKFISRCVTCDEKRELQSCIVCDKPKCQLEQNPVYRQIQMESLLPAEDPSVVETLVEEIEKLLDQMDFKTDKFEFHPPSNSNDISLGQLVQGCSSASKGRASALSSNAKSEYRGTMARFQPLAQTQKFVIESEHPSPQSYTTAVRTTNLTKTIVAQPLKTELTDHRVYYEKMPANAQYSSDIDIVPKYIAVWDQSIFVCCDEGKVCVFSTSHAQVPKYFSSFSLGNQHTITCFTATQDYLVIYERNFENKVAKLKDLSFFTHDGYLLVKFIPTKKYLIKVCVPTRLFLC
ncbi:unnamed protein product [Didymodactylos carnosus]|uniref:Uncharacterized protein n=1 Tax=Didymodactylos carnosus TaxID=1234261 RepID=A0A8S2QZ55_9BILA|nr:unnamed protein product [Didymodactylos carnosus]CAF4121951.1 unnamed protein product [Didymodactylos carnosus]